MQEKLPADIYKKMRSIFMSESKNTPWVFYTILTLLYAANMIIINAKLNVWYFACSTSLITIKLFFCYMADRR